jgi:hypothetical protein
MRSQNTLEPGKMITSNALLKPSDTPSERESPAFKVFESARSETKNTPTFDHETQH